MSCPLNSVNALLAQLAPTVPLRPGAVEATGLVHAHPRLVAPRRAGSEAPPAHWLVGHLPDMKRDLLGFYERCERDFGAVVPLRLYNVPFYLVNDPEWIRRILVTDDALFVKPTGLQAVKPLLGEGLVCSDGEYWRTQRALMQPSFHKKMVDGYAGAVTECTRTLLERWDTPSTRNVCADMSDVTLDVVSRALFGMDITAARPAAYDALRAVQEFFTSWRRHYLPLPIWVPLEAHRKLQRAVEALDAAVYAIVDARRNSPVPGDDLLSRLLQASRGDDPDEVRRMLRDELVVMMLAGHETTAAALSWALLELARHPRVRATLREEIDGVVGGRAPTVEDLPRLPYLANVIKEILRLYPSLYNIGRVAKVPYAIEGHTVRPGENVIMCQWSVHRSRRHYDAPHAFLPERWTTERARTMPKFAYFPFGGGPRNCIGGQFALLEMKLILAAIVDRYDFELEEPSAAVYPEAALTLRPTPGVPMRIERREL